MKRLYGEQYESRYQQVASLVPPQASVVELCPGDGKLFEAYLNQPNPDYVGIEMNESFCQHLRRQGMKVIKADVQKQDFPEADVYLMHASLYQFENHGDILQRMYDACLEMLIVAEPIENIASKGGLKSKLAAHLTNPGDGAKHFRFTKDSLRRAFEGFLNVEFILNEGHKEAIVVVRK